MLKLDPEIAAALVAMAQAAAGQTQPALDDIEALRDYTNAGLGAMFARLPDAPNVRTSSYSAAAADGGSIPLSWYWKDGALPGAAVIYVHGGGMICGSTSLYDRLVRYYVELSGVSFLSVGYRLAPEHRKTGLAKDIFTAISWLKAGAQRLGIDSDRIAIMGDSGGGGIAAAAAIMARNAGLTLSGQILIYPMLDDRNVVADPLLTPTATWSYEKNQAAWRAVLGEAFGGERVPHHLAPARLEHFAGLPPAYIEVGELDIFRDESIAFAQRLYAAGVSCELHVHPGAPHGHDWLSLDTAISRRVFAERARVLAAL
jgi:acetyl esterase/lipase